MITRLCAVVLLLAFVGPSAEAQSILLGEGQAGPFFQAGIVGADGIFGVELDLGYALSHHLDLGVMFGYTSVTTVSLIGTRQKNLTLGGQSINLYPISIGKHRTRLIFGLHEAYVFTFATNKNGTTSVGTSINLMVTPSAKDGIVLRAGYMGIDVFGEGKIQSHVALGLLAFTKPSGKKLVGVVAEYNITDGPDSYGVGMTFTKVLR